MIRIPRWGYIDRFIMQAYSFTFDLTNKHFTLDKYRKRCNIFCYLTIPRVDQMVLTVDVPWGHMYILFNTKMGKLLFVSVAIR